MELFPGVLCNGLPAGSRLPDPGDIVRRNNKVKNSCAAHNLAKFAAKDRLTRQGFVKLLETPAN
jgi:hypothetical protein